MSEVRFIFLCGDMAGASPATTIRRVYRRAQPCIVESCLGTGRRAWEALTLAGLASRGVNLSTAVILSAAKDLRSVQREILRCAQDDRWLAPAMSTYLPCLLYWYPLQKSETHLSCPSSIDNVIILLYT